MSFPNIRDIAKANGFTVQRFNRRDTWLEARRSGIGASEAAAVLGFARWGTPLEVYASKLGLDRDDRPTSRMEWGLRLQNAIARAFAEETGRIVKTHNLTIVRRKVLPFQISSLDGIQFAEDRPGPGILEIKTGQYADGWTEGDPPEDYQLQAQHQLATTGLKWGSLAVLISGYRFLWTDIERHERVIKYMEQEETAFWRHVQDRQPPEPHEGDSRLLSAIYSSAGEDLLEAAPDERLTIDGTATEWGDAIARRDQLKVELKEREREKEAIENAMKARIATNAGIRLPDNTVVTWSNVKGHHVPAHDVLAHRRLYVREPKVKR